MALLLLVSFIWAFSYGLIKGRLGDLDSNAVATLRLALAFLVFVPFFRPRRLRLPLAAQLVALGAVQFGLMYLLYQRSFTYLPSYAVVLFTLTMPLYITLADACVERRLHPRFALAALLALIGAALVVFDGPLQGNLLTGFLLMQASNLCFAAGQIAWRRLRPRFPAETTDASLFALAYFGAVAAAFLGSLATTNWAAVHVTATQGWVLVYLGVLSSGMCFFWWNLGATRVNAGTLAVFNNAKVPLGVACSLLFFHESANLTRLLASGVLMGLGVWVAERKPAT
jgi:drug/metabolite transporter (DMT)-like permease